jgi:hypothetical protein
VSRGSAVTDILESGLRNEGFIKQVDRYTDGLVAAVRNVDGIPRSLDGWCLHRAIRPRLFVVSKQKLESQR